MKKTLSVIVLIYIFASFSFAYLDWQTLKTGDFTVFYQEPYELRAMHLLSDIEYWKDIPRSIAGNTSVNVPFILEDYGQYDNGLTDPVYYRIDILNSPTEDVDWLSYVVVHEYTHMVHLTKTGGIPSALTFICGNALSSQIESPDWTFEGIAVYGESKLTKYMGRLNDGGFDQYMSMRSAESTFPSLLEATYVPFAMPSGDAPYIYGSKFLNFLAQTYGEDKLKKYYDSYSSSFASYLSPIFPWLGMDRTMDETFGGTTETLWEKWRLAEKEKAAAYKQEGENITNQGWLEGTPVIYNGLLYYSRSIFEKTGAFDYWADYDLVSVNLKTNERKVVATSMAGFTAPPRFFNNKIYFTVSETKPGYANETNLSYGYYTVMYEKDLATGAERELFSDAIRGFCIDDAGRVIYSVDNVLTEGSQIMGYDIATGEKKFIMDTDYLVLEMAYGSGRLAVSAVRDGSNADLYLLDIDEKKFTLIAGTPYYEMQPEIYGNRLFFRANYGKTYSAYCYDLAGKKIYRLTRSGAASSPAYDEADNEIYFAGLNTNGFDIYREKADFMDFTLPDNTNDYTMPPLLDASKVKKGGYGDDLATLCPKVRVPFAYMDDNSNIVGGIGLSGSDAMSDFTYIALGAYDFGTHKAEYSVQVYSYMLSPVVISMISDSINNGELAADATIPLYRSQRPGLESAFIDLNYKAFDGLGRREIFPGAGINFAWPSTLFGMYASRMFEGKWLGSTLASRQGLNANMDLAQYLPEMKISLRGSAVFDPDNTDNMVSGIRGYSYAPSGNIGSSWDIDITRPLVRIRNGLWNPVSIYLEDICGGIFADAAFARDTQYSFGAEIKAETKFFFLLETEVGVRFSYNRDGKFDTTFLLTTPGTAF